MNRRQAGLTLAAFALAQAAPRMALADPEGPISLAARALYERGRVLDANLFPPLQETLPWPKASLDILRDAGVTVMTSTLGGFAFGEIWGD